MGQSREEIHLKGKERKGKEVLYLILWVFVYDLDLAHLL